MPIDYAHTKLQTYLEKLSSRQPVPGGGSAAALSAALGAGLIAMVANYSIGRKSNAKATDKQLVKILRDSETLRRRLLHLAGLDAQAYLNVVAARKLSPGAQKIASRQARAVPQEVCRLCFKAMDLASDLAGHGNPHLLSDVEVAVELLQAAFNGAKVMVKVNS